MSRARVWKREPSLVPSGIRTTFIPSGILDGPRDSQIEVVGLQTVQCDKNQDFIIDPKENVEAFDGVHTFVLVRQVMTMYQRALWRIGKEKPLSWQWGPGKAIQVYPRAGNNPYVYYSRQEQCLKFFYFKQNGKTIFTNRSYDVVAHEAGHAILDALRPGYWASWQPQTSALHESFGDITAILSLISKMDQCEAIIAHSKADLRDKSYFNAFAEETGVALGKGKRGLRSADNDMTLEDVSYDIHQLSQVFTSAFYDILADIFSDMRNPEIKEDAETLYRVGDHMTNLLVEAVLRGPPQNATFKDIADKLLSLEKDKKWKTFIKFHFERRFVIGANRVKAPRDPVEVDWSGCGCCMSTREHLHAVDEGILRKQTCLPCRPTVY